METIPINPLHLTLITIILNFLGATIKAIPQIPNQLIPLILATVGCFVNIALAGWTGQNAVIGFAAAILAVGGHSTFQSTVNAFKKEQ
jgi:hypothetical protein